MLTQQNARDAVITAIEAGGRDVARLEEYDVDAIVKGVYDATGGYDTEDMPTAEFWTLVEEHRLAPDALAYIIGEVESTVLIVPVGTSYEEATSDDIEEIAGSTVPDDESEVDFSDMVTAILDSFGYAPLSAIDLKDGAVIPLRKIEQQHMAYLFEDDETHLMVVEIYRLDSDGPIGSRLYRFTTPIGGNDGADDKAMAAAEVLMALSDWHLVEGEQWKYTGSSIEARVYLDPEK